MPIDKDSCKIKEDYEPWTSEGNLLNFTKTDEESKEGSEEGGYRYLRGTRMHYLNGELWIVVPYYESNYESAIKRYVVEVWKREGRHFTRVQEIPLFKEDGSTNFQGSKNRKHTYLNRGMLHKNSKTIVLHSGNRVHAFDLTTGQRIAKNHWNSTCHVICHNPSSKMFQYMDCACYSYNKCIEIISYDPENQIVEEAALTAEIPIMLDGIKQELKKELLSKNEEEVKEEVKEGEAKEGEEEKKVEK